MALEHDASTGFLRGESIAAEVEQLAQELSLLRQIESNTSDIAKRLGQLSRGLATIQPEPAGARHTMPVGRAANDPVEPRSQARPSQGNHSERATAPTTPMAVTPRQPGARRAEGQAPTATPAKEQVANTPKRDTSGRFSAKGTVNSGNGSDSARNMDAGAARAIGGSIVEAARDMGSKLTADVDNVDPTIQAAKEVSSILSPAMSLFKPLGRLFGRGQDAKQTKEHRENVTWLRRIWRTQADANKGKGRGGLGGMLGMLLALVGAALAPFKALARLLGAGRLLKAAGSLLPGRSRRAARRGGDAVGRGERRRGVGRSGKTVADHGGAGAGVDGKAKADKASGKHTGRADAKGGGLKGMAKSAGGSALKMGKGLLRKIPVIGALIGGLMVASDVMADDDPELSAQDNKTNKWGSVGGGVGGLVGGVLGMLGGPAGAIAGGLIGEKLGGMVGEWLATVDFDSVLSTISSTFTGLADTASKAAGAAFDYVKEGWSGLVTAGTNAITGMAEWARDTWKAVTDKVEEWKDTAADTWQDTKDYAGEKVTEVADAGSNILYKASGGRYGSGGSSAAKDQLIQAMDAGGITDPKSKAMLMANVDHESGGFTKTEENLNYSAKRLQEVFPKYYKNADDARADAGNPEAIANKVYGGRMGNKDPGDGYKYRGRGALQLTGRAQYEEMGKKLGVDLVNNPELAADPKYSAQIAVQHWKSSGADKAARAGDMDKARRLTNGGTNGLEDVKKKYEETYLAQAQAGDLTPTRRADELKVDAPAAVDAAVANTMSAMAPPKSLANAQAVTPIGVMAPTQPRPVTVANTSIPATLAAPKMASYAPAAADASQTKIPSVAEVKAPPAGGGGKEGSTTVNVETPLSQNVNDRGIAHASAGGIGMWPI